MSTEKEIKAEVEEALRISYEYVTYASTGRLSYWGRAVDAARQYERILDPSNWQTSSQIYLPMAKAAVDVMLPNIMWYLFSHDDLFDLYPGNGEVSQDQADKVRDFIRFRLLTTMNIWSHAYTTLKDAAKLGVGYGVLETEEVTPWHWKQGMEPTSRTPFKALQPSTSPKLQTRYRYIRFGRILPSPGGGPNPADRDWVIHIDHVSSDELEAQMANEDTQVYGDIEQIKKDTLSNTVNQTVQAVFALLNTYTNERNVAAAPAMHNRDFTVSADQRKLSVMIPVVKFYGRHRHFWLANGNRVIMAQENAVQSLRCPVLRASLYPDADEWFTDGIISGSADVFHGENILFNTVVDMVGLHAQPRFIRNRALIPGDLDLTPWGVTDAYGPAEQALSSVAFPQIRPEVLNTLDRLGFVRQLSTGQSNQLQAQGASGIMRGGSGAFETLLQSTSARDKMSADILDMTFMKDLIDGTILNEQMLIAIDEKQEYTVDRAEKGQTMKDFKTVTYDDLRNDYRVQMSLRDKLRNQVGDSVVRQNQVATILSHPEMARVHSIDRMAEHLVGDRKLSQWLRNGADPDAYDATQAYYASLNNAPGKGGGQQSGAGGAGGDQAQQIRLGGVGA